MESIIETKASTILQVFAGLRGDLRVTFEGEQIGDPTLADGILDRLVHSAHRIEMRGEPMRKKRNPPREEKTRRRNELPKI